MNEASALSLRKNIQPKLRLLYGEKKANHTTQEVLKLIRGYHEAVSVALRQWDEKDVMLITYPDAFRKPDEATLKTLQAILLKFIGSTFTNIHILPFFPFSSDRGYSVIDYMRVKDEFGGWKDIQNVASSYRLMSDFILNHISAKHEWFQKFLEGDEIYKDYFIWFKKEEIPWEDLKKVTRSRATPLVTPFMTKKGERYVWTTYSVGNTTDQVDVNYKNPAVFLGMVSAFLNLLSNGVRIVRFDGASGIWKELGTSCRDLPQTKLLISLFHDIGASVCPSVLILTEATTASQQKNLSYLDEGKNGPQLVYNFALAPLVMHSIYTASSERLSAWAKSFRLAVPETTVINCLDIHDGINTHAASEFMSSEEMNEVIRKVTDYGAQFSYRSLPDGSKVVKEMQISWWSAINGNDGERSDSALKKWLLTRAIAMAIRGIPSIYYMSLFGSPSDVELYKKTGIARDMNRRNYEFDAIVQRLNDPETHESKVLESLKKLVEKRKSYRQFHPDAKQVTVAVDPRVFAIERGDDGDVLFCAHNVSGAEVKFNYKNRAFVLGAYEFIWEPL